MCRLNSTMKAASLSARTCVTRRRTSFSRFPQTSALMSGATCGEAPEASGGSWLAQARGNHGGASDASDKTMTRWEVFQLLAECLRPAVSSTRPRIPSVSIPWELVVEASSDHLVSPALGWCLRNDDRVPAEVFTCFETLLELNRRRNSVVLDGLEQALTSLNSAGITPMLLKGTATLADDLYPDSGMRVLGDIDLLIPKPSLREGVDALQQAGFTGGTGRSQFDLEHHH